MSTKNALPFEKGFEDSRWEEAFVGKNGVERDAAVPLAQNKAIPVLAPRIFRVVMHHTIIEHPEHIESGARTAVMLLIASCQCH